MFQIEPSGIFGRKVRLDGQWRADAFERPLVGFGERVAAILGRVPARIDQRERQRRRRRERREPNRLTQAAGDCNAKTGPDSPESKTAQDQGRCDQHDVEPHESVLELGHHRRRRVAGGALPDPTLYGGDEVDDPGSYRDAERQDRGGGRMLGQRRCGRCECDGQPGVQEVTEQDSHELRQIDASTVTSPENDRQQGRARGDEPSCQRAPALLLRSARRRAGAAEVRF